MRKKLVAVPHMHRSVDFRFTRPLTARLPLRLDSAPMPRNSKGGSGGGMARPDSDARWSCARG
jgi:hypothetical protein